MTLSEETKQMLRESFNDALEHGTILELEITADTIEGTDPTGQWVTHTPTGARKVTVSFWCRTGVKP